MKKMCAVLCFIVFLFFNTQVNAAVWYVDNVATGANNGTSWGNAWTSFARIVWGGSGVVAGDTVYISGGSTSKTYNDRLNVEASGVNGSPITIQVGQSYPHNGKVIISPSGGYCGLTISNQHHVVVSGRVGTGFGCNIHFTKSPLHGIYLQGSINNIILEYLESYGNTYQGLESQIDYNTNIGEIRYCKFYDNTSDEVGLKGRIKTVGSVFGMLKFHHNEIYNFHADAVKISFHGTDFFNNTIHDRGWWKSDHPDGIQFWSSSTRIYNNYFYNFLRTDQVAENSYIRYNPDSYQEINGDANNVYIYNNVFAETRTPLSGSVFRGIELSFSDPTFRNANNIYVMNNTFVGIPFFGLVVATKATATAANFSNIIIENNIFKDVCRTGFGSTALGFGVGNGSIRYGSHGSGANIIVDYNAIYASSTTFRTEISYAGSILGYSSFKSMSGCQAHDVTSNPLLNSDYSLTSAAPVRGVGQNQYGIFNTDIIGTLRPSAAPWDIGAYQYSSTSTISAPPTTSTTDPSTVVGTTNSPDTTAPSTTLVVKRTPPGLVKKISR